MDAAALEAVLDAVIAEHPGDWDDFVATDDPKKRKKLTGFFTGKVMAATSGSADGRAVGEALARRSAASAGD
jgi:aspartyl-tRNA(Asn)/glutamyl-tRNA(Gln) amidotransferase subunit B